MAGASKGMGGMMSLGSVPGTSPWSDSDSGTDPNGGMGDSTPTLASLQTQIDQINDRLDKANIPGGDDDADDLGDNGGDSIANNEPQD